MGHIYGALAQETRFADAFVRAYAMIRNDGVKATLREFCG
jgi:hypothetical protein